jgi:hypothetical protein
MRHSRICVLLSLTPLLVGPAIAADVTLQPLAFITNDRNADSQNLVVLLVAGQVVGLRFDTINGKHPHQNYFSLHEMERGAVLDGDGQHNAIVLHGDLDSMAGNVDLDVTYLSNGLFGKHKDCRADMVRDESGQWHILNVYDHKPVDHLVVRTWRLGISTIEGICPHPMVRVGENDDS